MTSPAIPLKGLDQEMASTRRLLERAPGEKGMWKMPPKSFPLGHLMQLISRTPGRIAASLRESYPYLAQAGGSASNLPTCFCGLSMQACVRRASRFSTTSSPLVVTFQPICGSSTYHCRMSTDLTNGREATQ